MSDKELQQEIYQYAERREYANNDIDYVVPMSDMPEIIALVREDEKQRCIDAVKRVPTGYQIGFEWKRRDAEAYKQELIKAIKEGKE